jgi:ABC-2 type transport system ATP-binding protein
MTMISEFVIETKSLGKSYGRLWALRDCTIQVPRGRISALVGPNGSGKTTLLRLLVGLSGPSEGEAHVLGRVPSQKSEFIAGVGFLAQEAPLYRRLTVTEHLEIGAHLNPVWDRDKVHERLADIRIPFDRPVSTLSGGQRSQVALALALAKRPQLLLLDEPVAALDPLARQQFLSSLAVSVVGENLSVVMSSHSIHDLEQVCDHLILLSNSQAQLCDDIDTVLSRHRRLVGPRRQVLNLSSGTTVITATHTDKQTRLVVRLEGPVSNPSWEMSEVTLEDVVLAYMARDLASGSKQLSIVGDSK